VIAKWLSYDITSLSLIPTSQFGTCSHSSTVDAGLCLAHDVETAHMLGSVCGIISDVTAQLGLNAAAKA
jgi:hypothetical protein